MSSISIPTGGLSLILNGSLINDFVEGSFVDLTLPNALTSRLTGANDSVVITERVDANVCDLVFRVTRLSPSDKIFLAAINQRPRVVVFNGSLKEEYFSILDDEDAIENWTLEIGTLTNQPVHSKNNQDGTIIVEYTIQFRNARRVI